MAVEKRAGVKSYRELKPSVEIKTPLTRPKVLFYISLVCALVVLVFSFFKEDGFKNVFEIDEKIRAEQETLERTKAENELLREKIKTGHSDTYRVEKFAREKLNLVKRDELVFRFHEDLKERF